MTLYAQYRILGKDRLPLATATRVCVSLYTTYIVVFVELLAVLVLPLASDLRLDLVERVEEELLHLTPLVHDHLTTQITHRYKREGDVSGICTKKDYAGLLNTT
jgi:hypothetical protein